MSVDFLYLDEQDMIDAGVLDAKECMNVMEETMSLFGKKDFLMGGPKSDEHGLQINFPVSSPLPEFPLDDGPDRRFNAMPAYLGGRFHIAGVKWYGSNVKNISKGLPRSILMVTLNDVDTGVPLAYLSANLVSAMRTGAMPAMAASYLARKDSRVLSLVGPGVINKAALRCYMTAFPAIDTIKIRGSSSTSHSALQTKAIIEKEYPQVKHIQICDSLEEACRDVDILSEAMSMRKTGMESFDPKWLKNGCSVFSMGSFYMKEPDKIQGMKMVVDNYGMYEKYMDNFIQRGAVDELGRKREWVILGMTFIDRVYKGLSRAEDVLRLSDIVNRKAPGRESEDEIILCSIGGMPIEDLSWSYVCYQNALKKNIGTSLKLWDTPYLR